MRWPQMFHSHVENPIVIPPPSCHFEPPLLSSRDGMRRPTHLELRSERSPLFTPFIFPQSFRPPDCHFDRREKSPKVIISVSIRDLSLRSR